MAEKDESTPGHSDSSERSSAKIRNDIAARRESISQTVDQLGERIHEVFDWKGYVRRYPYEAVGVAFGTGLVVATLLRRKSSPMDRVVDALVDRVEELGDGLRKSVGRVIMKTAAPGLLRGTLYGLAGKALIQYLQNRVAPAEGNGANLSPGTDWREMRRPTPPTSTPSAV